MKQEIPNKNSREYSTDVLREAYKNCKGMIIFDNGSNHLKDAAGVIEDVSVSDERIEITYRCLDTPLGRVLEKVNHEIRPKIIGNVNVNGFVTMMEVVSFDVVIK